MQMKSVALVLAALMCGAAIAAVAGKPSEKFPPPELEKVMPRAFGDWSEVKEAWLVVSADVPEVLLKTYDEVLTRTYVNGNGDRIMLSMAWGDDQRGERQVHRPEICYPAQGFKLETLSDETLRTPFGDISVRRLTTSMGSRHEPVTYWVTMAGDVVRNDYDKRLVQLHLLRTGHIPDGLLFRVSSIDRDSSHAFEVQRRFVVDLMAAMSPDVRLRVSGLKPAGTT
jgi:EpsI family protein